MYERSTWSTLFVAKQSSLKSVVNDYFESLNNSIIDQYICGNVVKQCWTVFEYLKTIKGNELFYEQIEGCDANQTNNLWISLMIEIYCHQ